MALGITVTATTNALSTSSAAGGALSRSACLHASPAPRVRAARAGAGRLPAMTLTMTRAASIRPWTDARQTPLGTRISASGERHLTIPNSAVGKPLFGAADRAGASLPSRCSRSFSSSRISNSPSRVCAARRPRIGVRLRVAGRAVFSIASAVCRWSLPRCRNFVPRTKNFVPRPRWCS